MNNEFVRRSLCRVCSSERLSCIVDYGDMPLAGDFRYGDVESKSAFYPMDLYFCEECSLVQIINVISADVIFDDYRYLSSVTNTLKEHFKSHAEYLHSQLDRPDEALIIEFGCNDGVLLGPLKSLGISSVGVDAAENLIEQCKTKGYDCHHGYFNQEMGRLLVKKYGLADLVTASNVFAHIDDIHAVMAGVDCVLKPDGKFVVEIHYIDDLIELNQYDTVYHEHLCYYSLHSLERLFSQYGFVISDVHRHSLHGGSIRVTAARSSFKDLVVSSTVPALLKHERESGFLDFSFYENFGRSFNSHKENIYSLVKNLVDDGKTVCAYGAAGRATMLLNYCRLDRSLISFVVDESPSRIGRQVPGVNLPIVSRDVFHENPTDFCLITAWNFEEEIRSKETKYIESGGCFLLPLPVIRKIVA